MALQTLGVCFHSFASALLSICSLARALTTEPIWSQLQQSGCTFKSHMDSSLLSLVYAMAAPVSTAENTVWCYRCSPWEASSARSRSRWSFPQELLPFLLLPPTFSGSSQPLLLGHSCRLWSSPASLPLFS